MEKNTTFFSKNKYILALVLATVMTTAIAHFKENKSYNFNNNNDTSVSDDNGEEKNHTIINNLVVAKTVDQTYLLVCPEGRGLCINYETEEFMFMYSNTEQKNQNLRDFYGEDVQLDSFKKYLVDEFGEKEKYTSYEIEIVFDKIKNNNKILVKC